jgi:hypothetical protein
MTIAPDDPNKLDGPPVHALSGIGDRATFTITSC